MIATGIRDTQPKPIAVEQTQRHPNKPIPHCLIPYVLVLFALIVASAWHILIAVSNGKLRNSIATLALPSE